MYKRQKLNRISRKLIDILNIVDTLDKNKIAFRSLTESFETETPAGKLQLNIMGAIGEFERGTIAAVSYTHLVDICLEKSTNIEILINCYPQYPQKSC